MYVNYILILKDQGKKSQNFRVYLFDQNVCFIFYQLFVRGSYLICVCFYKSGVKLIGRIVEGYWEEVSVWNMIILIYCSYYRVFMVYFGCFFFNYVNIINYKILLIEFQYMFNFIYVLINIWRERI